MPSTIKLAVIPGDGIGKEVTAATLELLEFINSKKSKTKVTYDILPYSADFYLETGNPFRPDDLEKLRTNYKYIFGGAFGDPRVPDGLHAKNILLGIRQGLDLYVNLRPIVVLDDRLIPLKGKSAKDIEFTIIRENTEGLYVLMGGKFKRGTEDEIGIDEMVTTRKGVKRLVQFAAEYTRAQKLGKLTLVDKANVLHFGHEIWRRTFYEAQKMFPSVQFNHYHMDAAQMEMLRNPQSMKVIVTENLFGDIISDLAAELSGGLGFAASANFHPGQHYFFEPVHGSAPDIAGKGIASPIAAFLTLGLFYEAIGEPEINDDIRKGLRGLFKENVVTYDVHNSRAFGVPHKTAEYTKKLIQIMS